MADTTDGKDDEQVAFDVLLDARDEWQQSADRSPGEQAVAKRRYLRTVIQLLETLHAKVRPL